MKAIGMGVAVVLAALAIAPAAFADGSGGPGGAQAGIQAASTVQGALGVALSHQNAVNANVPVNIAGGNITAAGSSTATQTATSSANADVSNKAKTDQDQHLNQNIGGSGCVAGCGGAGGFQAGVQAADTKQIAVGAAKSDQNAVNANVPVNIAGGNVNSGPSSATQTATSTANTNVKNKSKTDQDQTLDQNIGGSGSCKLGCGGAGGFQAGVQAADTKQAAVGISDSHQNAVNANVPVNIAGGDINSGPSSATQTATSTATTNVKNKSKTDQDQHLNQNIGSSGCYAGCGGPGGFQLGVQKADTQQLALGFAKSDQNAVNGNAPVNIAGGDINSGPSSATQTATSTADTDVENKAKTDQDQGLEQNIGNSDMRAPVLCSCEGRKKDNVGRQNDRKSGKYGKKGRKNGSPSRTASPTGNNSSVSPTGNNSSVSPTGNNSSVSPTGNNSSVSPTANSRTAYPLGNNARRSGTLGNEASKGSPNDKGSGNNSSSGGIPDAQRASRKGGCAVGCGGAGGFQLGIQGAETKQAAIGVAKSHQNAVNSNAPSSVAGKDISGRGPSNATQTATSTANANVENKAKTDQEQGLHQNIGDSGCVAGCGGAGGFQAGVQLSKTEQLALGFGISDQNAVNGNAPHSIAGGNISDGGSNATQTATSTGNTDVKNKGKTDQNQWEDQLL
jgi:hypothetical protein